jgi:hypothetical protein
MTDTLEFEAWPKIPRLNRGMIITEKIDGTNAAVIITEDGEVGAQSRTRLITPEQDNYGFAGWVERNREALALNLGPGRHFGEWWGAGVQRRYGMQEKRFSLFNTHRWEGADLSAVPQMGLVPVLYRGAFSQEAIEGVLDYLRDEGSAAAPGFRDPEGIVVYLPAARQMYKVTLKGDQAPKGVEGHALDYEAVSA